MSPLNILEKGFTIVKYKGKITSHINDINVNEEIEVISSNTSIKSKVTSKTPYNGNEFNI